MSKKILNYLIITFPFLDLVTAILTRYYNLTLTPGLIVKGIFIVVIFFYLFITKSKYKKISMYVLILVFLYVIGYFITKPDLLSSAFILNEITYLFKLFYFSIMFLGLLCFYDENKFSKEEMVEILKINLISVTLLLLIPLLTNTAFNTYPEFLKGYIGWFYAGNEVANIMIMLFPFVYYFANSKSKYLFLIFLPVLYVILNIGTKVSLLGLLIIVLITFIFSLFYKKGKIISYYSVVCLIVLIITGVFSINSYAVWNYKYTLNNNISEADIIGEQIIIDDKNKAEVSEILNNISNFYNHDKFNIIFKSLLSGRDAYLANTISIYNDATMSNVWFGIGFSDTDKVNNPNITKLIEIDVLDGYFHYGILGLMIMFSPFIISLALIIKSKHRITKKSLYYSLIMLLILGISCFSGHVLTAPAVSIYLVFYLLLLLNEFNLMGRTYELENRVSILSLHMGYGGIEKSIVDQANMLSEKYETQIICLYKLYDDIPYKLNDKVEVIYLSNLKPNKEEFLKYFHKKNILKMLTEGFKSVYILYKKRQLICSYVYNSKSKIMISTRLEFTKILNRYGNNDSIKIAEEHVYHKENKRYLNKVKRSLKNINYLIPASKYLTNDYRKYLDQENIEVKYIPQTISYISKNVNKCNNMNIISVGRLSKEKGFLDLIEVFKKVNQANPKIKLTIVGDGQEKDLIVNLITKYNLEKSIKLTGYLNSDDLQKEYKKSSLYVMTSFEESFGLVLIEAMSYGIPCYAFSSALGATELIDNKCGKLIDNRDIDLMANEIINYFNKKDHSKMSSLAYKKAESYYTENVKNEWFKFVDKILKEK